MGVSIARISIYEGNPRRLRRYRCRRRSPASTSTSTLCACRVATRRANSVRVITPDGCSKRACMRHSSSLHVAHQLPVQSTFQRTRRLRRRGLAASPPCTPIVVNKKTCRASMICVTILRLIVCLFLHDLISENAKTTALARAKWQMRRDQAETHAFAAFWPCFRRVSRGETALRPAADGGVPTL